MALSTNIQIFKTVPLSRNEAYDEQAAMEFFMSNNTSKSKFSNDHKYRSPISSSSNTTVGQYYSSPSSVSNSHIDSPKSSYIHHDVPISDQQLIRVQNTYNAEQEWKELKSLIWRGYFRVNSSTCPRILECIKQCGFFENGHRIFENVKWTRVEHFKAHDEIADKFAMDVDRYLEQHAYGNEVHEVADAIMTLWYPSLELIPFRYRDASIALQKVFSYCSSSIKLLCFEKWKPILWKMCAHPIANYTMRTLVTEMKYMHYVHGALSKYGSPWIYLICYFTNSPLQFVRLSCDHHGSFIARALFREVDAATQKNLISALCCTPYNPPSSENNDCPRWRAGSHFNDKRDGNENHHRVSCFIHTAFHEYGLFVIRDMLKNARINLRLKRYILEGLYRYNSRSFSLFYDKVVEDVREQIRVCGLAEYYSKPKSADYCAEKTNFKICFPL